MPAFSISSIRTMGLSQARAISAIISARLCPPLKRFKLSSSRTGSGVMVLAVSIMVWGLSVFLSRQRQCSVRKSRTVRSRTNLIFWERWATRFPEVTRRSAGGTASPSSRTRRPVTESPAASCSMSLIRRLFPEPVLPAMAQRLPGSKQIGSKCSGR